MAPFGVTRYLLTDLVRASRTLLMSLIWSHRRLVPRRPALTTVAGKE